MKKKEHEIEKKSNLYGLQKVYTSSIISDYCKNIDKPYIKIQFPEDLKFRSIVAGPENETHRLSNYVGTLVYFKNP